MKPVQLLIDKTFILLYQSVNVTSHISIPFFKNGERYRIQATCTYQDESFGSFDCTITDRSGCTVATAQMTAFQPEGDVTPEKLEAYT
jgi:hypothetical protein